MMLLFATEFPIDHGQDPIVFLKVVREWILATEGTALTAAIGACKWQRRSASMISTVTITTTTNSSDAHSRQSAQLSPD